MATGVKRDILRSVIVLSAITLVAGILLSVVFQVTRITPEEERQRVFKKLNAIYLAPNGYVEVEVESRPGESVEALYKADGEDYYIVISNGAGYKGPIQLYVSFEGTKLVMISLGSNSDTPGIKEDVCKESSLAQFDGDINEKDYSQAQFDAVAGATYTSGGVIAAVRNAVTFYKNYLEGKTPEQLLLEKLNAMHEARNGWVKIETDAQFVNGMYRALGEDYYIVRSTGNGYRSEKRGGARLEVYVLFSGRQILDVKMGEHEESENRTGVAKVLGDEYLAQYKVNIDNVVFKFKDEGSFDFDATAEATFTQNGILEAVTTAVNAYKAYLGG